MTYGRPEGTLPDAVYLPNIRLRSEYRRLAVVKHEPVDLVNTKPILTGHRPLPAAAHAPA